MDGSRADAWASGTTQVQEGSCPCFLPGVGGSRGSGGKQRTDDADGRSCLCRIGRNTVGWGRIHVGTNTRDMRGGLGRAWRHSGRVGKGR